MKRLLAVLVMLIPFVIIVLGACSDFSSSDEDIQPQPKSSTQPTTAVHTVTDWNEDGNSAFSEVIINGRDCIVASNGVPDCDFSHVDTRFSPTTTTTMGYG